MRDLKTIAIKVGTVLFFVGSILLVGYLDDPKDYHYSSADYQESYYGDR